MDVVYTPWFNLRKTPSMDVGQVGFHNSKLVRVCGPISMFFFIDVIFLGSVLKGDWVLAGADGSG